MTRTMISQQQFDAKLVVMIAKSLSKGRNVSLCDATFIVEQLFAIPGIYEILSEDFNNDVIKAIEGDTE